MGQKYGNVYQKHGWRLAPQNKRVLISLGTSVKSFFAPVHQKHIPKTNAPHSDPIFRPNGLHSSCYLTNLDRDDSFQLRLVEWILFIIELFYLIERSFQLSSSKIKFKNAFKDLQLNSASLCIFNGEHVYAVALVLLFLNCNTITTYYYLSYYKWLYYFCVGLLSIS